MSLPLYILLILLIAAFLAGALFAERYHAKIEADTAKVTAEWKALVDRAHRERDTFASLFSRHVPPTVAVAAPPAAGSAASGGVIPLAPPSGTGLPPA